jgi:WD40 repeat protein
MRQLCYTVLLFFYFTEANAQKDSIRLGLPLGHSSGLYSATLSPDGKYVVTAAGDNSAIIWGCNNGKPLLKLEGHSQPVLSATFSPDGKKILTASKDGTARIWDAVNGKQLHVFHEVTYNVNAAYSHDGKLVLTFSDNKDAKLWDATTGQLLRIFEGHSSVINSAFFAPNGKTVLTGSCDRTAKLWDVSTGKELVSFIGHTDYVTVAKFSSDGKSVITASRDHTAKLWDGESGKLLHTLEPHNSWLSSAAFSANGKMALTISVDNITKIWSTANGELLHSYGQESGYEVRSAVFISNGEKVLISRWQTNSLQLFDANNGKLLTSFIGHSDDVNSTVFSPDGKKMLTASDDKTARLWDVTNGKMLIQYGGISGSLYTAMVDSNATRVLTASSDGYARLWDLHKGKLLNSFGGHVGGVSLAMFTPNEKVILTADEEKLRLWEVSEGSILDSFEEKTGWVKSATFSRDTKTLLTVSETSNGEYKAKLFDVSSSKTLFRYGDNCRCGYCSVNSATFSPDGAAVLTAESDYATRMWSVSDGKNLISFEDNNEFDFPNYCTKPMTSAVFSADGKKILATSSGGIVQLWDAITGKLLVSSNEFSNIKSAVFSSDSNVVLIVDGRNDYSRAILWDVVNSKLLASFKGHNNDITSAVLSPDGKILLTASEDNTAKIWHVTNGKLLISLEGHAGRVKAVFSPNGEWIITSSLDGSFIVWEATTGKKIMQLFAFDGNESISLLPSKYYQCTKGIAQFLYYIKGLQTIGFDQLDVKYNRPDKVLTELGNAFGNPDTALINSYYKAWQKRVKKLGVDTTSFEEGFSVPEGDFKNRDAVPYEQASTDGKLQLKVWGMDSTYKLDRFNVWVNEVPVFGQRGVNIRKDSLNTIERAVTVTLSEGENKIETSVLNVNGIESYRVPLYVRYTPKQPAKEKLYFVGIGIDKYKEPGHNLQYSAKDIRDLAAKLKEQYGNNVEVDTLLDENVSIKNIKALKQHLLQSTVNDKVIVAFSGHGLLSKDYDYYISTYNVNFNQPELGGLPYEDLEWLLDSVPARKKLMLIDACHSGELDKEEIVAINKTVDSFSTAMKGNKGVIIENTGNKTLGLKNSFELMQELFANVNRGTGATVIAASGGTQFAQEHGSLRNGVFTYSILELMQNEKEVTVSKLKTTVGKRVEELTNGNQKPTSRNENIEFDWKVW